MAVEDIESSTQTESGTEDVHEPPTSNRVCTCLKISGGVLFLAVGALVAIYWFSNTNPPAPGEGRTTIDVPGFGRLLSNVIGDGVTETLGIPYALPPTGKNRFRPPQPLSPQHGDKLINATSYGPMCPQISYTTNATLPLSEDCLTLNIWAPAQKKDAKLPVYLWIHGGGYIQDSGRNYNSSGFARRGIVAVTINYRLGAFGFLPLEAIAKENPEAPGNGGAHGYLDQVAAMRWVKENIVAFGGDPAQVTIGGESAGSSSVCSHLHLPVSQGLFHRAVMESASCGEGPWGWAFNATRIAETVAPFLASVGASGLSDLRQKSWQELLASPRFIQINAPSADGFYMKKEPYELPVLTKEVKVLTGSNTMDTLIAPPFTHWVPGFGTVVPNSVAAYEDLVSGYFGKEALSLYPSPGAGASTEEVNDAFYHIAADVCNTCPMQWIRKKFLEAQNEVFAYQFGFSRTMKGLACHGCEMGTVFDGALPYRDPIFAGSFDQQLATSMADYWASFIKGGTPLGDVAWPQFKGSVKRASYLDIATSSANEPVVSVMKGLQVPECLFFERVKNSGDAGVQALSQFCNYPVPRS